MTFGQWIKQQREQRGMATQPMLAEAMSAIGPETVGVSYVSQLEVGRTKVPQQPFLRQLAGALGVEEVDVLYAAGLLSSDPRAAVAPGSNPFGPGDERARIVDALWRNDPFVVQACLAVVEHAQRHRGPRPAGIGPVRVGQPS